MSGTKVGRFRSEEARAEFLGMYESMREHWPVAAEEMDVETGYGTTHVRRSGVGGASPIVLIHGNMGTSLMWWRLMAPLSAVRPVFALDTMGALGLSVQTKPIEGASDYGAWMGDVITQLGLDRPHLVGFSEGGYVAMNAALGSVPVGSLVAIEPGGAIAKISKRFLGAMAVAGIKAQFSDNALRDFARRLTPGFEFVPGEIEMMTRGAKSFKPALPFPRRFTDEELENITVPTLLYMGSDTELYDPVEAAARANEFIPDVETLIVPEARHGLPFQFPELTINTILDFATRVEAR
jgi:pimeloyl-ACP methyl ester carboxylesterase